VLLKNVIGLLRPDRGEICVDGENIVGMGERDLYRVRRKMGVLFRAKGPIGMGEMAEEESELEQELIQQEEEEEEELGDSEPEIMTV